MRTTMLLAGLAMLGATLTGSLAEAQIKDPTQSRWYRGTNWVDRPAVQRYVESSRHAYRENRDIIWGTMRDAPLARPPYLILKGVFGYPRPVR
jgi:hypothetical protein